MRSRSTAGRARRRVIYLDFDGQMISGTGWNNKTSGACYADPYDTDASPAAFSTAELTAISGVWARVAEDYASIDVDVTTVGPGSRRHHPILGP